ncbi:serine-type peptidase activity protein [[Candida] boidinii]|nr:serine-type peptidase activity protein [[Candida] boidinii]OWB85826.1 serine-type peptidase activity protein [[Candida] boidinii]
MSGGMTRQKRSIEDDEHDEHDEFIKVMKTSTGSTDEEETDDIFDIDSTSNGNNSNDSKWQRTVENVIPSVVSIHFAQTTPFDTESSCVSEATGFIVDSEIGLILTNRHVIGVGPFIGYAVFDNHEECEVKPIYRDPVHDFGFLKFNPLDIKYMEIKELKLRPELAKIGVEIRVIGNDSGEKLSILSGFISRLDRNTPDYGNDTYNDFNTEYYSASANASGGSSGSPVIDQHGNVIALQAGGSSESSSDFFLPLHRILRALKCVQQGEAITRGTIQVQWSLKPFNKCRRLGLREETETRLRLEFPSINGMLVATMSLPEGPADESIKEGDCLKQINGTDISSFITVDEILDSNVGNDVTILIERNGRDVVVVVKVQDLHGITPDRYVSVCGAVFNNLSYQFARSYNLPVKGVFIASPSGSFNIGGSGNDTNCWLLHSIDNKEAPDLDTFIYIMRKIPDKKNVILKYYHLSDLHVYSSKIITIDRHWFKDFKIAIRNDKTGLWDFTVLQENPLEPEIVKPLNAKINDFPIGNGKIAKIASNFVSVECKYKISIDSYYSTNTVETGIIINREKGYVIVSRNCVCHDLCDISINIAESIVIPAKPVFFHPNKGYAIIKYDPSLVLADINQPEFGKMPLEKGDEVTFVGYTSNNRPVIERTKVLDIVSNNIIPVNTSAPKYRGTNLETILLSSKLAVNTETGVLVDQSGLIRAVLLTFDGGDDGNEGCENERNKSLFNCCIDISDIIDELHDLLENDDLQPVINIIDCQFKTISVARARIFNVPEGYISKLEKECREQDKVQFLSVIGLGIDNENKVKCQLQISDIVLSINDQVVSKISDLKIVRCLDKCKFTIVRDGEVVDVTGYTTSYSELETEQVISWSGALLQSPPYGVKQTIKNLPSLVYCTGMMSGSPSKLFTIGQTNFITHVNEEKTPDIDEFLRVVKGIPDNTYCKIRIVSFDNIPYAQTLKVNYHYFPTFGLQRDENKEWKYIDL